MSVMIFYKLDSEYARQVIEFLHEFEKRTAQTIETVDPDSPHGGDLCRLYDVVEYPSIVATNHDGQLLHMWRGTPLPLINEVSGYVD
jgi:hypothetical protein